VTDMSALCVLLDLWRRKALDCCCKKERCVKIKLKTDSSIIEKVQHVFRMKETKMK